MTIRRTRISLGLLVVTVALGFGLAGATAADLAHQPRWRARHVVRTGRPPPTGYAYGGYGNGPGPGWIDSERPGYAPGIVPGWGYIPAGAAPTILDLGY